MALIKKFYFVFVLLISLVIAPTHGNENGGHGNGLAVQEEAVHHYHSIPGALLNAGYTLMSHITEGTLLTLYQGIDLDKANLTIFCPTDEAFLAAGLEEYIHRPSLELLQYHIALTKVDREDLETLIPFGSKLDTLRHDHPLVVTTVGHANASINNVPIEAWNLYNNGKIVVHGVHSFFDPAFQTAEFPWLSSSPINSNGTTENNTSSPAVSSSGPETINAPSPIISSNGPESSASSPINSSNGPETNTSVPYWTRTLVVILAVSLVVFCAMLVRALTQKFLISKVEVDTPPKVFPSDSKCKDPNVVSMAPVLKIVITKV
ncbi:hypothetical protein Scep_023458 [Stephania cephalantha]|uniref:FAS1 domain-containing protein n=1 Tax=Stephania cephalantha TaxID=152367 RepID=A0AAP0F1W2_9MAGN